ncbi:MAG: hypothetical protein ACK5HR_01320 [Mycoplasmatales bacterium]
MQNKDFEKLEQYMYLESILENLDTCVNRIQKLEEKDKVNTKKIKHLKIFLLLAILVLLSLIVIGLIKWE